MYFNKVTMSTQNTSVIVPSVAVANSSPQATTSLQACNVCNELSANIRPGSMTCNACKKFFLRNQDSDRTFSCESSGTCLEKVNFSRRSCQACRLQRCLDVGLTNQVKKSKPTFDIRCVPCVICGASSTGYHFGVLSCEGCKGFFRRAMKGETPRGYTCETGGNCVMDPLKVKCKKCRLELCLKAGMSLSGSHIGRQTNARRAETKREIDRLQSEQKLLKEPIMVRQLKRGFAAASLASTPSPPQKATKARSLIGESDSCSGSTFLSASPSDSIHSSCVSAQSIRPLYSVSPFANAESEFSPRNIPSTAEMSNKESLPSCDSDEAVLAAARALASFMYTESLPESTGSSNLQPQLGEIPEPLLGTNNHPSISHYNTEGSQLVKRRASFHEDFSRQAVLERVKMPVMPSEYIWMSNSGSDWVNISSIATNPSSSLSCLNDRNRPFSLGLFVRLLDADHLLTEPHLSSLSRGEWLLGRATAAVRHLSHIKNLRIYSDPGLMPEEVWRQGMICFEYHTRFALAYVRALPGYKALCPADRTTLFTNALFPIVVAQLSLDYDLNEHEENFMSLDSVGRELMSLSFPQMRQLRQHVIDAGTSIKSSKFNIVEFSLITALVFFNSEVAGLVDPEKVTQIGAELKAAAFLFTARTYNETVAQDRLRVALMNVDYLSSLFQTHTALMADFAMTFPHLINVNPLHNEMFTGPPTSITDNMDKPSCSNSSN